MKEKIRKLFSNVWTIPNVLTIIRMLLIPVVRPRVLETTAMGAALLAGLGAGIYGSLEETAKGWQKDLEFTPRMDEATRRLNLKGWHKAVERSKDWAKE